MKNQNLHSYHLQFFFFIVLIIGSLLLLFFILKPFLSVLFFAVALAVVFYPVHKTFLKIFKGKEALSAFISVLTILFLILIPLALVGVFFVQEAAGLYETITKGETMQELNSAVFDIQDYITDKWPSVGAQISERLSLTDYLKQALGWVLQNFTTVFSGFVWIFLGLVLMILSLFYFFKDGAKLENAFVNLNPLSEEYSLKVLNKIRVAINSVLRGRLLVAIIQGVLISLGFWIFGIPNPILWGMTAVVLSILPFVGPLSLIVPAALYAYFISGSLFGAIGLVVWGVISTLIFDDYLTSVLVDRRMKIHPLLILLSVMGGLVLFGPIGFILGPVSLSLFFALLEIYPLIVAGKPENK